MSDYKGTEQPTTNRAIEILIIEDNMDDLELALSALKAHNLSNRIHVARDGAEALEVLFCTGAHADRRIEDGPKLVLLDLKLPKVDGIDVLKQIKLNPATCTIPVVVMTSSKVERDIVASYQCGANSYIVKPVDFDQFSACVRQLGFYWLLLNELPKVAGRTSET